MKKLRKILPVILMAWPYLFVISFLVACDMGDDGLSWFTGLSMIGTIAVYGLNIVNAFRRFDRQEGEKLAFYDMLIKLIHIPFYILVFVLGMLLAAVMVVPIFVMLTPFLILMLAIGDFFPDDHVLHVRNQCCPAAGKNRGDI